ncbi:immunoglobulin-binding protein 1-like [Uloborus diversus]|uniref:immunoglobulin-binding protein 1-like n=1 Tax=Uloborus diversus TaxID=327109 RepID=UPI00240A54EE|nr:immunoglobulin-binding protein 1-like [Uloborus diversus]
MTNTDLKCVVNFLKHHESESETSDNTLGKYFDSCLKLCDLVESCDLPTGDSEFQDAVATCIKSLEKCTLMVNELNLFSSNETIEEIQTSSLKYLLLPALLGSLKLKIQNKEMAKNLENIKIAETYFHDFLHRCKNYEICRISFLDKCQEELLDDAESNRTKTPIVPTVSDLAATRQRKIELYKEKKKLQAREKELKPALERKDAEEYIREYYLVLLERWIVTVIEELDNTKREKPILESIVHRVSSKCTENLVEKKKKPETKPLKPFIITKDEIQKRVFGMGYPSLPVMTIDDFYRQRFEKYVEDQKSATSASLQDRALKGEADEKEVEEIHKEELLEKDDPEALQKARNWDDWKEDNPRGSGNRKNKG